MNLERYNALDSDEQQALQDAMKEATAFQRERSQELETDILANFDEQGITVTTLTQEQKQPWQQAVIDAEIYELVKSKMNNPEYLDQLLDK